jgi:hypothetical protein
LGLLIFNFAKAGQRLENIFLAGSLEIPLDSLVGVAEVNLLHVKQFLERIHYDTPKIGRLQSFSWSASL